MKFVCSGVLLSALLPKSIDAFSRYSIRYHNSPLTKLASNVDVNAEGIVLQDTFNKNKASLLESAFDALRDDDKYDAVLTGLCSKILDGK